MSRPSVLLLAILAFVLLPRALADAAPESPDGKGPGRLAQALLRLPVVASLLYTGAHPDDENNALLSYAGQGLHARTAYLSLNRGEGGQNLIGAELYDGIGIIRTEELLAARKFDGATQYFTRAYDFGFSKSAEEALTLWNRNDTLLADVVRIIRTFRPDVVVSGFAGTPADGHGQHQAAGLMTREAFRAAADPKRFPDQIKACLRPWQATKLYIGNTRATFLASDSLDIPVGEYSPILDRSFRELGLAGSSMHRSQDMGAIQMQGPATVKIKLTDRISGPASPARDTALFDGIDTSFMRLVAMLGTDAARIPAFETQLRQTDAASRRAIRDYRPFEPSSALPATLEALRALRHARQTLAQSGIDNSAKKDVLFLLDLKEQDMVTVIRLSLGLLFEVLAGDETVTPGSSFPVTLQLLNRSHIPITPIRLRLDIPDRWTVVSRFSNLDRIGYNEWAEDSLTVSLPIDARLTRPYWRRDDLNAPWVTTESDSLIGLPWRPPDMAGYARFVVEDVEMEISGSVQFRYANPSFGEIRREIRIIPALSIHIMPEVAVVPLTDKRRSRAFPVTLRNHARGETSGVLRLQVPAGWKVIPETAPFTFTEKNQEATLSFTVETPEKLAPGVYQIRAVAEHNGKMYTEGFREIAYPHIETRHQYREAVSIVHALDIGMAPDLKVGYVMGVGDDVPEAIRQLGAEVRLLDKEELASGDLNRYDVIVAGIRAYEARPDLAALNHRLLEYVRTGGTFIVQYNQYVFNTGQFGPYPASIRMPHDRVTDENAPIER
ncbi:MAG: PIG-L family deacetylase, partial [candidate division Zixibacteria bacterium]|nr:PIG-L family deacetylase [candidate division Zixibacteria bacterium]